MSRLIYVGTLLTVLLGSFFLTLWLLGDATDDYLASADPRSDGERLAGHRVANYSALPIAARDARLRPSMSIVGHIDALTRINERDVALAGWLADPEGDASPLQLIVFVSGSVAATTQTKGERPDVTKALVLAFGSEKNVAFGVSFPCAAGQQPVVVGVGMKRQYFPLTLPPCP